MKHFILIALFLTSNLPALSFAFVDEDSDAARQSFENLKSEIRENASRHWESEISEISARLAAANRTTVYFDPNYRDTSADFDMVDGRWVLGNGGTCLRAVGQSRVVCEGAVGVSFGRQAGRNGHRQQGNRKSLK